MNVKWLLLSSNYMFFNKSLFSGVHPAVEGSVHDGEFSMSVQ